MEKFMCDNFTLKILASFVYGLIFGVFTKYLFISIILIMLTDAYVLFLYPKTNINFRMILNITFLLGWMFSKLIFTRRTGFEEYGKFSFECCEEFIRCDVN